MSAGVANLRHVLENTCTDPDCELHHPEMIEDKNERLTALAWFTAGAQHAVDFIGNFMDQAYTEIYEELRDTRVIPAKADLDRELGLP